jgi:hypothetical protein
VVERLGAGGQPRAPRAELAVGVRLAGGRRAAEAAPPAALELDLAVRAVERGVGEELVARGAGPPGAGGDLDDAVGGPQAVERRRRRPLEHLDALDVGRVEVEGAVRVGEAVVREVGHGHRVVDRHAVHHEQRLPGALDGLEAADDDAAPRARVARLRGDLDARRLGGERVHHVDLALFRMSALATELTAVPSFSRVDDVPDPVTTTSLSGAGWSRG